MAQMGEISCVEHVREVAEGFKGKRALGQVMGLDQRLNINEQKEFAAVGTTLC